MQIAIWIAPIQVVRRSSLSRSGVKSSPIENISSTPAVDPTCTRITQNVARAYKTRICLFEASFRKYHTEYNQQATAAAWYGEVVTEANAIKGYSLHEGAAPRSSRS